MREEDRIIVAETTTKNIYSIFNGVEGLKSAEFVGFRIPTGNNIYLQGQGFPTTCMASMDDRTTNRTKYNSDQNPGPPYQFEPVLLFGPVRSSMMASSKKFLSVIVQGSLVR